MRNAVNAKKDDEMTTTPKYTPQQLQQIAFSLAPQIVQALHPHPGEFGFVCAVVQLGVEDTSLAYVSNVQGPALQAAVDMLQQSLSAGSRTIPMMVEVRADGATRVTPMAAQPEKPDEPS